MPELFHQNMRTFRTGLSVLQQRRYRAYFAAFQLVAQAAPNIAVAGFTEVMNRRDPAGDWPRLAGRVLGVGAPWIVHVAIGRSALMRDPEYLVIASRTAPLSMGRIVFASVYGGGLTIVNDRAQGPLAAPPVNWARAFPTGALADYRGIAYGVWNVPPLGPIGVGFLHNIWAVNDNKSLLMQRIPDVIDEIGRDPVLQAVPGFPAIYLLGDYNAPPALHFAFAGAGANRASQGIAPRVVAAGPGAAGPTTPPVQWQLTPAQQAAGGQPGGTTLTGPGSLYDYTMYGGRAPQRAGIDVRTLDYRRNQGAHLGMDMSDHCAVVVTL